MVEDGKHVVQGRTEVVDDGEHVVQESTAVGDACITGRQKCNCSGDGESRGGISW